jgi:hypothetical protein
LICIARKVCRDGLKAIWLGYLSAHHASQTTNNALCPTN